MSRGSVTRSGGMVSVTTMRSISLAPSTALAAGAKTPCAAAAKMRVAPRCAAGLRRADDRVAGGDQIVDDDRDSCRSTSPTSASPVTTPPLRYFSAKAAATGRPSAAASRVRNASARLIPPASGETTATSAESDRRREMRHEQRRGFQVLGAAAKRILKRGEVVHIERYDAVGSDRLEQLRNVARGDGIAGLALAVLARVGEVRNDRRSPGSPPRP